MFSQRPSPSLSVLFDPAGKFCLELIGQAIVTVAKVRLASAPITTFRRAHSGSPSSFWDSIRS
jgi:hypothetical protein